MSHYIILDENLPDQREKLRRYWTVFQTTLGMMMRRNNTYQTIAHLTYSESYQSLGQEGFELTPEQFLNMNFLQFLDYRKQTGLFQHRFDFSSFWSISDDVTPTLLLFLPSKPNKDVDVEIYNTFIASIIMIDSQSSRPQINSFRHFILLVERKLGSAVQTKLKQAGNIRFEIYNDASFAFDVTQHCLSPVSTLLIRKSNTETWEQQEGINSKQLHYIHENDQLSVSYGARVGDIFVLTTMGVSHDLRVEYKLVIPVSKIEPPKPK